MKNKNSLILIAISLAALLIEYCMFININNVWNMVHTSKNTENSIPLQILFFAVLPYFGLLLSYSFFTNSDANSKKMRAMLCMTASGIIFSVIANGNASHAGVGFLFLGFIWQWLVVLNYLIFCYKHRN